MAPRGGTLALGQRRQCSDYGVLVWSTPFRRICFEGGGFICRCSMLPLGCLPAGVGARGLQGQRRGHQGSRQTILCGSAQRAMQRQSGYVVDIMTVVTVRLLALCGERVSAITFPQGCNSLAEMTLTNFRHLSLRRAVWDTLLTAVQCAPKHFMKYSRTCCTAGSVGHLQHCKTDHPSV